MIRQIGLIVLIAVFAIILSCEDNETGNLDVKSKNYPNNSSQFIANKTSKSGRVSTFEYKFNGSEGDPISFEMAKAWTANYRETYPVEIEAHFFGREIINQILSEEGCVGIRIYYALDENGNRQLLLVGVNANGDNLLPSVTNNENIIADMSYPCPTFCPPTGTSF